MWFANGGLRGVGYLRGRGGLEKCQGMGPWYQAPDWMLETCLDQVLSSSSSQPGRGETHRESWIMMSRIIVKGGC